MWVLKKLDARETRASRGPEAMEHHARSGTITLEIGLCKGYLVHSFHFSKSISGRKLS